MAERPMEHFTVDGVNIFEVTDAKARQDVSDLKEEFSDKFPIGINATNFFENVNYGTPENVEFVHIWVDGNGLIHEDIGSTNSLVIDVEPNTTYYYRIPSRNRVMGCETSGFAFDIGSTYSVLSITSINNDANENVAYFTTGNTANKVLIYFYSGTYNYDANKNSIYVTKNGLVTIKPYMDESYTRAANASIHPLQTTFFDGVNYFNSDYANFTSTLFFGNNGIIGKGENTYSVVFPVEPSTQYYINIPNANRCNIAETHNDSIIFGDPVTPILVFGGTYPQAFTTSQTAKFVAIYFNSGAYDVEANKDNIILCKGSYVAQEYVKPEYISNIDGANILIFGDSITDCCNLTVNANKETTSYTWRNPSNSYVNDQSVTVNFSMWAKILKENQPCGEIRNYARSGASYKTQMRTSGEERQNLQYQIDVAMNDLDNPNGAFSVGDYVPDIVVFALGTNDGTPNDTYESAMSKTVLQSDNMSIDVNATLSALDDTKFCESARKAFMRIKQAFPMAQIYCVLPIQRADRDNLSENHNYLEQMAKRYGCIIIDGAECVGITRDFNTWDSLGTYLKDGLHPNEKGQNLMARAIINAMNNHYKPFGTGFNTVSSTNTRSTTRTLMMSAKSGTDDGFEDVNKETVFVAENGFETNEMG